MNVWYECRIRYQKTAESGKEKKVSEIFLVDALSFTEAESRIIEEARPFAGGEMKVTAIRLANVTELFASDEAEDDKWYRVKAAFITLDEKSGKERRSSWYAMVQASTTERAEKHFHRRMEGTLGDYRVESITETAIMDVYPYAPGGETDETR